MDMVFIPRQDVQQRYALEKVYGNDFGQKVQASGISGLGSDVGQDQVIDNRAPDLGHDRVFGGSEEGFDLEVVLDPFEEDFDLPSEFVDLGDGCCGELEVIGQKNPGSLFLRVPDCNQTQWLRVVFFGFGAG